MENIGDQIKGVRQEKGWSQEELARAIGATKSAVSRYEAGKRQPSLEQLEAIAKALGVPIANLLIGPPPLGDDDGLEESPQPSRNVDEVVQLLSHEIAHMAGADRRALLSLARHLNSARSEGGESTPAPQAGKDTTPAPDGSEGPQEGGA